MGTRGIVSDHLIALACTAFVIFLIPWHYRKYAAIAGWSCIVLNLFSEIPAFAAESNFLYPLLAVLSVPFLVITTRCILDEDPVALRLTTTAAVAAVIFVPVATIPILRDTLVAIVIQSVISLVTALGHHPWMYSWDVIVENGFYNQIIPGCTGILAIAMVTGVIASVPGPYLRRLFVIIIIVPVMFVLNILRVAAVFIAVSDHWFSVWPDPTGTGNANFFWAHNVIAEALAILFLIMLVIVVSRVLPGLWEYARDVGGMYAGAVRNVMQRGN